MAPVPLNSRVLMMKTQSAALQLSFSPNNGKENLKKPELVSSPTDLSTEEEKSTDFGKLVVCIPGSKAYDGYAPKEPCFPDKEALGIQPSLDEITTARKNKRLKAENVVIKRKLEKNDVGEERAAVEHDDEEDESYLCVKWNLGEALKLEDDLLPNKQNFVDHVSLLSVNCPESSPIQESESSDSDAIDEQGPPSVILIDSSEEIVPEKIEEEHLFQEVANVKVDKKSVQKPPRKRHTSGKRKRNIYLVVDDSPPVHKQLNRTPRYQPKRKKAKLVSKPSTKSEEDIDSLIAEFYESAVVSGLNTPTAAVHHKAGMRSSPRVSYNTPRDSADSGLESGSFGSDEKSSSNGSSGSSGSNTGGGSISGGGGTSGGGSSGGGDDQGNGEESHEKDEESVMVIDDTSGDEEEDSEESNSAEAMEEDCVEHAASACGVDVVDFDGTDLQHACYCKPGKLCRNINCNKVKDALNHIQTHQTCKYFVQTYMVIKVHAATCKIQGCRVPHCVDIRKGKVIPAPVTPPGVVPPHGNQQHRIHPAQYSTKPSAVSVDGRILFNNSDFIHGAYFQEHTDYHVQRKGNNKLGEGSNGKIFRMFTPYHRHRLVVKETSYKITMEEIKVYNALKSHEHLVQHYGVAFKGSEGEASVFMEECGPSLYDFMRARGRLDPKLAMYFWSQILDAVVYMHNLQPWPVIHKDIKAKNVLLCEEETRAKLADFDSARTLQDELTKGGLYPRGTKGFVAPEVWNMEPHGTPADMHGMGGLLLELTVGVPKPDTLPQQVEQLRLIDEDLADLVVALMNPVPQKRPTALQVKHFAVVKKYQTAMV